MRSLAIFFLISSYLLSSCSQNILTVHTDYLSLESLASYEIGTPDPLLQNPPFGQRLILSWNIPKDLYQKLLESCKKEDTHTGYPPYPFLEITIRFRTRQEQVLQLPIRKMSGTALFSVLNEKYCATQGIATYRVRLIAEGRIYEEWRHQLWKDLIRFQEGSKEVFEEEQIPEEEDDEITRVDF